MEIGLATSVHPHGGPHWTPALLSPSFWLRASDESRFSPKTGTLTSIADAAGGPLVATPAAGKVITRTPSGGKGWLGRALDQIAFDGVTSAYATIPDNAGLRFGAQGFHGFWVGALINSNVAPILAKWGTVGFDYVLYAVGPSGFPALYVRGSDGVSRFVQLTGMSNGKQSYHQGGIINDGFIHVIEFWFNASTGTIWIRVDDDPAVSATIPNYNTSTQFVTLGAYGDGGTPSAAFWYDHFVCSRVLSAAESAQTRRYYEPIVERPLSGQPVIHIVTDSFGDGAEYNFPVQQSDPASNYVDFPRKLQKLLGTSFRVRNCGVSSNTWPDIQARRDTDVTPWVNRARGDSIVYLCGRNDLTAGTAVSPTYSAATIEANAQEAIDWANTKVDSVYLCTLVSGQDTGAAPAYDTVQRPDMNGRYRARTGLKRIIDLDAIPELGGIGQWNYRSPDPTTTLPFAQSTHLSPHGNDLVANAIKTALGL